MTAEQVLSTLAPQFDNVAGRDSFLVLATDQTSPEWFGKNTSMAVALLAAHFMTLSLDDSRQDGSAGAITSKREGDLAVGFNTGMDASDLGQTHFGRQRQRLIKAGGAVMLRTGTSARVEIPRRGGISRGRGYGNGKRY